MPYMNNYYEYKRGKSNEQTHHLPESSLQEPSPLQRPSLQQQQQTQGSSRHQPSMNDFSMTPGTSSMGYHQHNTQQQSHSSGGRAMMRSNQQQQQHQYGGGMNIPQSTPGQDMRSGSGSYHYSVQQLQQYDNSQGYSRKGSAHGMSQQQQNYLAQQQQHQQPHGNYHSTPPMMGHHTYGGNYVSYHHQHQQQHGGVHHLSMMGDFPDFHPLPPSEHFQRRPNPHHQYSYEDDSPRSPSPPQIPPPPPKEHQQPMSVPPSAPPKLRVDKYYGDEAVNSNNSSRRLTPEDAAGPLRESRHHNTLEASASGNTLLLPKVTDHQQQQGEGGNSTKKSPSKPVAVQHASLLLGLRDKSNTNTPEGAKPPREQLPIEKIEKQEPDESERPSETPAPVVCSASTQPKTTKRTEHPNRLAVAQDRANLNSMHCFIRSELLEVFVVDPKGDPTKNSMAGRVGMQCVHCARNRHNDPKRRNEATMAVFYPRSVQEIYRLVTNWTRCHLNKCRNIPPDVRKHWDALKSMDKTRGKTQYWTVSAQEIGLVNCTATRAGGVRFADIDESSS